MSSQSGDSPDAASGNATKVSRRSFVLGAIGVGALFALGALKFVPSADHLRPPSVRTEDKLLSLCIRCGRCIQSCPSGIIVPMRLEDGLVSAQTPTLNFSLSASNLKGELGWCDFCESSNNGNPKCSEMCPTGALHVDSSLDFKAMSLGVAEINRDWCLAWRLKGCSICIDVCPLEVITEDEYGRPAAIEDACNGCGRCEQVCPSMQSVSLGEGSDKRAMTSRAITVVPKEDRET